MNSFENDLFMAICSVKFVLAVFIEFLILRYSGFGTTLHMMSVPILCTLPYTCAWLDEWRSGFIRLALPRTTITWYIIGKFAACVISGGLCETIGMIVYSLINTQNSVVTKCPQIFLNAALWAGVSALLAAWSNNKYSAYGGSFVICFFMIIVHERYWKTQYIFDPQEWINPDSTWLFGNVGLNTMLIMLILVVGFLYAINLERRIENV